MTQTGEILLFCLAFLGQILLISWFYPRRVVRERRFVLQNYPPSTHARLYPQPLEYYEGRLRAFERLNLAIVIAGVAIITAVLGALFGAWDGGIFNPSRDQEWNQFVVIPYFVVQMIVATVYLDLSSFKHHKAMALSPPPRVRTTELHRPRITDFVSPASLVVAGLVNLAFVGFILYYRSFEFPWFTAAGNLIGVSFMMLMFCLTVVFALYAYKPDPYQASDDRRANRKWLVRGMLTFCTVYPVLIVSSLVIKAVDPDMLEPFLSCLYSVGCALALLWPRWRVDRIDYDVYRSDARA